MILPNIQVLSQIQSLYHFINSKSEELASSAFEILVNKELTAGEYEDKFNSHSGKVGNLSRGIYFYQLKVYSANDGLEN
jgi:hypothetical protein